MNLDVVALLLIGVALFELAPLSIWLDRARWPHRAPRAGVVVWQAIGISSALAIIGAGLAFAVVRFDTNWLRGTLKLLATVAGPHPLAGIGLANALGLTLAADVAIVLTTVMVTSTSRVVRSRARHRRILDLVAVTAGDRSGTLVLDHPRATAYCLPGFRPRIVVSTGAIELLEEPELAAVVEHERGHVHEHHGMVMLSLFSWIELFRWVPYAARAPRSVSGLLEMAADDFAARRHDPRALAGALVRMTAGPTPSFAFGVGTGSVSERIARLVDRPQHGCGTATLAGLAAAALVALPIALCAA